MLLGERHYFFGLSRLARLDQHQLGVLAILIATMRTLRDQLLDDDKTRWLDFGCGGAQLEPNFTGVDILDPSQVHPDIRGRYHQVDMASTDADLSVLGIGSFDFVRSQHTLEHLTWEDGAQALANCAKLLKPGGIILITTPDLRIHVERYLKNDYATWSPGWLEWAQNRLPIDAPSSALFSVFANGGLPEEPHVWCYDADGLTYQLDSTGQFADIRELALSDAMAEEPFTHNRSNEDVCVLAYKI